MSEQVFPVYVAAVSKDRNNVMMSSSGGMFWEICKAVLQMDGVVYGAKQETPLAVFHERAETIEEVNAFRRSKYIRSELRTCYEQVKKDLLCGKKVLFSGVACQIAGLCNYLKLEYPNLYTCEVVCHGAPLNEALAKYVHEQEKVQGTKLLKINFRDKREGWNRNCITELYENKEEIINLSSNHPVHQLYLKGINMQCGCSHCCYQKIPRIADITLADFWKCQGEIGERFGKIGISLVTLNSDKGMELLDATTKKIVWKKIQEKDARESCKHLFQAPYEHPSRPAFEKLIHQYDFKTIYPLFDEFGEVILTDSLAIYKEQTVDAAIDTFLRDTQEVVYFVDKNNHLQGIATFGEFVAKYNSNQEWINRESKIVKFEIGCEKEIRKIFADNHKINRIPVVDAQKQILFEVRRMCNLNGKRDSRKVLLATLMLKKKEIDCLYVHRPDFVQGFSYSIRQQVRIKDNISFPVILSNSKEYEKEIKDIFGKKASVEYVEAIGEIPPIVKIGEKYVHIDKQSKYINTVGGERITWGNPEKYEFTVHVYGRCGAFGYAVEDGDTLPSVLQELLNKQNCKVRVCNHGLWGADDEKIISNLRVDLNEGIIEAKDIVVIYMLIPWKSDEWNKAKISFIDTTMTLHDGLKEKCNFYDKPGHMNAEGYRVVAERIFDELYNKILLNKRTLTCSRQIEHKVYKNELCEKDKQITDYISECMERLPKNIDWAHESIGAIVMNCNPFTFGHQYLVKKAKEEVDRLIIFVVEEDRSFFPFELRYEMVRKGVEEMKNTYVLPSGKFMISSMTFPEYFTKESNQELYVNPILDVSIFGEFIAPAFHITKRFVGTEPTDAVTAQYNKSMKQVLPQYSICLQEIERCRKNGEYITATEVRRCMVQNEEVKLKKLLPKSTLDILHNKNILGEKSV